MATPDIHIGSGSKNSIERKLRIDSNSGVASGGCGGAVGHGQHVFVPPLGWGLGCTFFASFFFFFRCGQPLSRCRGEAEMGQH